MSDYDLDWDDDAFGGDIDFDDDFDMDPYKGKGFFSSLASGFLSGVTDRTIGSTDAVINTARAYLPKSFSNFFDNLSYLNNSKELLVREFQEANYETVKSLQNIAGNIAKRMEGESSTAKRLNEFAEKDFSSWEKFGVTSEGNHLQDVDDESVDNELERLMDTQSKAFQSVGAGINQMQAHVGGGIMAATKANGRELIGIQASLRELLTYQQTVQFKMDRAKLEILTRTYLVNAKYYKFMEKGIHTSVAELKKIAENSRLSDYEKTSLYTESKAELRRGVLGVVRKSAGGLINRFSQTFNREGREGVYDALGSVTSGLEDLVDGMGSTTLSKGFVGQIIGDRLSEMFVRYLPYALTQGPVADAIKNSLAKNPALNQRVTSAWNKTKDIGNTLSYNSNNGLELLNYFSQYWEDLETNRYDGYEDYVDQMQSQGKTPLPKALFTIKDSVGNYAKEKTNAFMWSTEKSQGTVYSLEKREAADLTKVSYWREINNITLNDVIPGLLSRIYESVEKLRTGNDNFEAPTFSYTRGQFVNKDTARQLVKNDIFNHSSFQNIALTANRLVDEVDPENNLTPAQRQRLALDLIDRSDKGYGFNPYYYLNEQGDQTDETQQAINNVIFRSFGIGPEQIAAFKNADTFEKLRMSSTSFKGQAGDRLNTLGDLSRTLRDSMPNITDTFIANRQAGNEQILRDLGLIYTRNGVDAIDSNVIVDRIREYVANPNSATLLGDISDAGEVNAGLTRLLGGSAAPVQSRSSQSNALGQSQEVFNSAVSEFTKGVSTLTETLGNVDFSKVNVNLDPIPDKLDTLKTVLDQMNSRDDKQYGLIEQMTSCVCRQAGGWGKKSESDKKRIETEEAQGKKTIMDRIKSISPRNFFNRAIETLVSNQPLVLGGILGGLGTLAIHSPQAAALVGGGMAISMAYGRLRDMSRGVEPSDDEDILNEEGEVLLHAAKLRMRDYYDAGTKKVIESWKSISGAVYDIAKKSYITAAQLSGKLFGADGRALIIKGLSKVKDTLNAVWNKIDIVGNARKAFEKGKEAFYQQDIYVKGEDQPKLTRSGFMNGRYYCYNPTTKQPFQINGWNEIDGPVYSLDQDGTLNQVVSEGDIAKGLITSAGVSLDKLKAATGWLGRKGLEGFGKVKDFTLEKAGMVKEKAQELIHHRYTGIESRLDRIYFLLCEHFGIAPNDIDLSRTGATADMSTGFKSRQDIVDDIVDKAKRKASQEQQADKGVNDKFNFASQYPNKIRLNSFEDKEQRKEKEKKDQFYEDVHNISGHMDDGLGGDGEGKGEKKGLFGKLASFLAGGAGLIKKLFTNPLGFMLDMSGKLLSSIFIKSPLRLAKIGSALFSGVLGLASPIYKVLSWGFGGVMWGLRKLLFRGATESFGDWRSNRKRKTRGKTKTSRTGRNNRFNIGRVGRIGGLIASAATLGYGLFGNSANAADMGDRDYPGFNAGGQFDQYPGNAYDAGFMEGDDQYSDSDSTYDNFGYDSDESQGGNPYDQGDDDSGMDYGLATDLASRLAGRAGEGLAERTGARLGGKALAKVGSRAIPFMGQALALYDGFNGYKDTDAITNLYQSNYVSDRQRTASGLANALDMGGLVSGIMNTLSDVTGMESLRQDGGMTRLIEKGLSYVDGVPLTPLWFISGGEMKDVSTRQRKVRLAMYGLESSNNQLGRTIETLEQKLTPYVRNSNNNVWIDKKAPIQDILSPLVKSGASESNIKDIIAWYRYRFEPVFKLWCSATQVGRYETLFSFDRSTNPDVLPITKQVVAAIVTIKPYPLDIVGNVDPDTPIMARQESDAIIQHNVAELVKEFGEKGVNEQGLTSIDSKIRTDEEVKQGVSEDTGFFASIRNSFQSTTSQLNDYLSPPAPKVMEIDISDLHKSGSESIEDITMLRLAAYGNEDNKPIRVDTVLRLERYCEQFFTFQGTKATWNGKSNEIFNLFKNGFGVQGRLDTEHWMHWFTNRFLPVLGVWVEETKRLRNNLPGAVWKTLTVTNRLNIGIKIRDLVTDSPMGAMPIWSLLESPFPFSSSTGNADVANTVIKNLTVKSTQANLRNPEDEEAKTNPNDISDANTKKLSPEQERALLERATGSTGIGLAPDSRSTSNNYSNTPLPSTMTYSQALNNRNSNPDSQIISGNTVPVIANAAPAFPKNNTVGIQPNAGDDAGFSIDPKMGEQIMLKALIAAGITDPDEQAFALANIAVETGNYKRTAENMNYSPQRLMEVFKRVRDKGLAYAQSVVAAGKPAIANAIYAGINGNKNPEDGWLYKGRGFIQLTGRGNYERYGRGIGEDIVANPRLVSDDPEVAAKTAVSFLTKSGTMEKYRNSGFRAGVKAINGGYNHLAERQSAYNHYKQVLESGALKAGTDEAPAAPNPDDVTDATSSTTTPPDVQANANDVSADAANKVNAPPADTATGTSGDAPSLTTPNMRVPDTAPPTQQGPQPTGPTSNTTTNQVSNNTNNGANSIANPITPPPVSNRNTPTEVTPTPQRITLPEGVMKVSDEGVVSAIAGLAEVLNRALQSQGPATRRVGVGPRVS